MFFFYNFIFTITYLFFKLFLSRLNKFLENSIELLLSNQNQNVDLWIHGVSAGEIKTALEIVKNSNAEKILITTFNQSGKQAFEKVFKDYKNVCFHYAPLDFFFLVKKFIKHVNPKKYIIIEHDLWPNLLHLLKKNKTKIFLLNARFQKRDIRNYKIFPFAFRFLYAKIDVFSIQSDEDKKVIENFKLKVDAKHIVNLGNLKYNFFELSQKKIKKKSNKTIVVIGSSHSNEEEIILKKLKPFLSKIILVIIPRHLNRVKKIEELIQSKKLSCQIIKKTEDIINFNSIYIVNSFGESLNFYQFCDIALIGDTFIHTQGGHNFLEAINCSAFTCYGKFLVGYSDVSSIFEKEQAVLRLDEENWQLFIDDYLFNEKNRDMAIQKSIQILKQICYDKNKLIEIINQ